MNLIVSGSSINNDSSPLAVGLGPRGRIGTYSDSVPNPSRTLELIPIPRGSKILKVRTVLTKAKFLEWWDEKEDGELRLDRMKTCPIARYLRENGFPFAEVDVHSYRINPDAIMWFDLPSWAKEFVAYADAAAAKKPYKGIPEGFHVRGVSKPR